MTRSTTTAITSPGRRLKWKRLLTREEFFVAEAYYNLRAVGDMHHNPQKNVLHVGASAEAIAKGCKSRRRTWRSCCRLQRAKMLAARLHARTPYVDKTIYTGWNGDVYLGLLRCGKRA